MADRPQVPDVAIAADPDRRSLRHSPARRRADPFIEPLGAPSDIRVRAPRHLELSPRIQRGGSFRGRWGRGHDRLYRAAAVPHTWADMAPLSSTHSRTAG